MIKRVLTILSLIAVTTMASRAQCPGSFDCDAAGVICSIDALNGFTCNNPTTPNTQFPTPDLCRGVGVPHNLNWWAFIGAGGALNLTFNFDINSCEIGQGIQAGVFEGDCAGSRIWDCNASCNTSTFTLSGVTTPCEIYYVWVDGCNGDVCTYTMSVNGSGGPPMLPPMPPLIQVGNPCAGGSIDVEFPGFANDCDPVYQWTVDGMPVGGPNDDFVTVDIPCQEPLNPIQVCLTATIGNPGGGGGAICDEDFVCTTVVPIPPPLHIGNCEVYCFEDQPVFWQGIPITSSCINPPCSVRTTIAGQDCCVDSVKSFILLPPPGIGAKDTFICDPNIPYIAENFDVYVGEVCDELVDFQRRVVHPACPSPPKMCDTSYYLTIGRFNYVHEFEFDCAPCSGMATIYANAEYDGNCPTFFGQVSLQLDWYNAATGARLGITPGSGFISVSGPGRYCFTVEGNYRGTRCPSFTPECIELPEEFFPSEPPITGTDTICAQRYGVYETEERPDICDYVWTVQSGGGRIVTPNSLDSNRVRVDWGNRTGSEGIICVRTVADCGTRDSCFTVTFLPSPNPDAGPDQVICGQSTNFEGVPDYAGGNWTQVTGPSMATIADVTDPASQVDVNNYGVFEFIWTETNLDCSGVDTVSINFRPDPVPNNIDTICNSEATGFIVQFVINRGQPPYTIVNGSGTITMDSIYRSDEIADNTPTTITVRDDYGCEFTFVIDHDCVCNNAPGDIAMDTIKNCGPMGEACADYDATNMILEEGLDTFVYVLYETIGMVQQTQLQTNHTGCFTFDPNTMNLDQVYYIAIVVGRKDQNNEVDYDGGCVQIAEYQPAIWYTIPTPDAGPDDMICGTQIDLTGTISVNGSNYRWLNTQGASFSDQSSLTPQVTVTSFGVYDFIFEEVNAICPNTDTVTIAFNESPEALDPQPDCIDLVGNTYQVCFTINGGTPPYTIVSGNGTITNGNMFCSDTLDGDVPYDIIVEDANGCAFTLPVEYSCDCGDTDVGLMDTSLLEVCVDECVEVQSNGTEVLQADEEAYFVLHTGSGTFIQNEIIRIRYDHTANPPEVVEFCFDASAGMVPGQRYYISRLVHQIGSPDDPCRRIAPGQPVVWYDYPNADAGPDQDFCGLSGDLGATPSLGTGVWTLESGPGNAMFAGGLASQMVTVDEYGTYTFKWTETNQGICPDEDEVSLTFHDAPRITNVFFECDDVAENYRIYIEVAGGDQGSWDPTGVPIADFSVNTYTTEWLPTGSVANFCVTDQWDCLPACLDTSYICECITEPGIVSSDDILCIDECVQASHTGGTLDPNDVLRYVLHDGDATNLGNIIECNDNGEFCFDQASMTANTTYYITVLAGNPDNTGCVDLTERCAVITDGVPVTWYEYPLTAIAQSEPEFTCEIDSMVLDGSGSTGPGQLTYQWRALNGQLCPSADPTNPMVNICAQGTYVLTVTHELSGCSTSDTITIDADEDIPAVDGGEDLLLTCDRTSVTLDGTGTDFGGDFEVTWYDPQGNQIGSDLQVTVTEPGTYQIYVVNNITLCDNVDEVEVTQDIMPPTADIEQVGILTCSVDQIVLDGTGSSTRGGVRSYQWSTSNGNIIGSTSGATIDIDNPGTYQLIIIDDINGCADTMNIPVDEIGNTFVRFDLTPIGPTCFGDIDGQITIDSTWGGNPPLMYSLDGGPFGSANVFNNLAPGDYEITVKDRDGCEMDTVLTVPETPEIGIEAREDIFIEAGEDVSLDTLIKRIFGVDPADADSIIWIDELTGERYTTRDLLDSLLRKTDLRVELWDNGCLDVDYLTIFVKYTRRVYIPNVIIPGTSSGIEENSFLTIHANKNRITNINFLRVYDRWGELVYSQDDIPYDERLGRSTEGWDGTFNGELMNPGVFVYHFQVEFLGGAIEDYFGDVTVLLSTQ